MCWRRNDFFAYYSAHRVIAKSEEIVSFQGKGFMRGRLSLYVGVLYYPVFGARCWEINFHKAGLHSQTIASEC